MAINEATIAQSRRGRKKQVIDKPNAGTEHRSKRYPLVLPEELYQQVERLAQEEQTSIVELLRRFIKLGLVITRVQHKADGSIILKEGDIERELVLL